MFTGVQINPRHSRDVLCLHGCPMENPRWDVLAATITASMKDLKMRQVDLVRESGLSIPTIRSFMSGQLRSERPTEYTMYCLEDGLVWPRGSVERILAGEDPRKVLETEADVVPIERPARQLSEELRAELDAKYASLQLAEQGFGRLALLSDSADETRRRLERLEAVVAKIVADLAPPDSTAQDG